MPRGGAMHLRLSLFGVVFELGTALYLEDREGFAEAPMPSVTDDTDALSVHPRPDVADLPASADDCPVWDSFFYALPDDD